MTNETQTCKNCKRLIQSERYGMLCNLDDEYTPYDPDHNNECRRFLMVEV